MKTTQRIWVVVADGAHARFFAADKRLQGLQPAGPSRVEGENTHYARDLKSDAPGRGFASSGGGLRHAIEPRHDYHKLEKHNFAVRIAELLDQAAIDDQFDSLLLVAPPRSLGEFRQVLSDRVKARLAQEVGKDLTAETPTQLWEMLAPAIRSVLIPG